MGGGVPYFKTHPFVLWGKPTPEWTRVEGLWCSKKFAQGCPKRIPKSGSPTCFRASGLFSAESRLNSPAICPPAGYAWSAASLTGLRPGPLQISGAEEPDQPQRPLQGVSFSDGWLWSWWGDQAPPRPWGRFFHLERQATKKDTPSFFFFFSPHGSLAREKRSVDTLFWLEDTLRGTLVWSL